MKHSMQDRQLYEYAVIRIVPRPEREEFINVGVIIYCSVLRFLDMQYELDRSRLLALHSQLDINDIDQQLQAFKEICCGHNVHSPIAKLDKASRFRWLTATRSTIVQTSKVHPGMCENPTATLDLLMQQVVH